MQHPKELPVTEATDVVNALQELPREQALHHEPKHYGVFELLWAVRPLSEFV